MVLFDSQIVSAAISGVFAVIVTLITVKVRSNARKKDNPVDEAFSRFIRQIKEQQRSMEWLFEQLEQSQKLISALQIEVSTYREQNLKLEKQLIDMQRQYGSEN